MRILYDTNVLVAILSRREAILAFKRYITQGVIEHVTSAHILREVEIVLSDKLGLTRQKAKASATLLGRQSTIVEPTHIVRVCRDPFDDYILAAALVAGVEYVVTADKDLLVLERYKSIQIITPLEFEDILRAAAHTKE